MPGKKSVVKKEEEEECREVQAKSDATESPAVHDEALRMSYRIARGEQGVLTFEPYKSALLPLWRFKTPAIARASAGALWSKFQAYHGKGDFVGMDMARKFIQMGMTRAKRYANHKGGRKYAKTADGSRGEQLAKSDVHAGRDEKLEASNIFRQVWEDCKSHQGYQHLKEEFLKEQKIWDKSHPKPPTSKLTGQATSVDSTKSPVPKEEDDD